MKNIPWPTLNPAYKRFQRLPELSLVKAIEEPNLRGRSAPVLVNLGVLAEAVNRSGQSGSIFASSA